MTSVTVSDTNLFAVAAACLRDATQWVRIAQLNGLADSVVSAPMTLMLPAADAPATGGILTLEGLPSTPVLPIDIFALPAAAVSGKGRSAKATWDGFTWDDGSTWQ